MQRARKAPSRRYISLYPITFFFIICRLNNLCYFAYFTVYPGIFQWYDMYIKRREDLDMYDYEKERREAIMAGEKALDSLYSAQKELNSAKNWGLVDMFGGGFFTTMVKRSKMGNAQQYMEQAKWDLQRFSRELNDVNMACNLHIEMGDFLSFADYFFDGFVADWLVQDRINNARDQVDTAIRRVEMILHQLG